MNEKILIVDDEPMAAPDLKDSLEKMGYCVVGAVDTAEDAIDVAAETVPDIVLMGIELKGNVDGIEAAGIISKLRIPILYLTANTDKDTFEKSNENGSYGFVSKPCDIHKLDSILKIAINRSKLDFDKLNDTYGFKQ